jgi:intracellular sulfur oxidation DsrE/DsrF family protein
MLVKLGGYKLEILVCINSILKMKYKVLLFGCDVVNVAVFVDIVG